MKKITLAIFVLLALAALGVKLYYSEQLKIAFNRPRYLYDGRHALYGDPGAARLRVRGEFAVEDERKGQEAPKTAIRLTPGAGVELQGEQSLSFVDERGASQNQMRLRPMAKGEAEKENSNYPPAADGDARLYFERRSYKDGNVSGISKDFYLGPEGLVFNSNATCYVPSPKSPNAAANAAFVLQSSTGQVAEAKWDKKYYRRVSPPKSSDAKGEEGDMAADSNYLYLYQSGRWLRSPLQSW